MLPLAIRIEDPDGHSSTQTAFIKSPVRIGRSELNDVPLSHAFVSSWHAVVQFDEREIRYVDLGSTNGSTVAGARLEKNVPVVLEPGSEVRIGALRLHFSRISTGPKLVAARPMTQFAMRVSELGPRAAEPPVAAPAPAPGPAPGPTPAQVGMVEQALASAATDLDLLYASYRATWEHVRGSIEQLLTGMDAASRALALERLAGKYQALAHEPQFDALSGAPPREAQGARGAPSSPGGGRATRLLDAFGRSYLPAPEVLEREDGLERLLGRAAEVLEVYSKCYVELRKGYEEFGKEMGVRTARGDSPVERARDARQLLAYLLDLRADGRGGDLQSAFADLMVHQVALLNGVTEGARGMLAKLDPEAVAARSGPGGWPLKAAQYWKAYQAQWHDIADEEDSISDALFGPEFARAYSAIVGRRGGEKDDRRTPPPKR